jgi:hypothetical protein
MIDGNDVNAPDVLTVSRYGNCDSVGLEKKMWWCGGVPPVDEKEHGPIFEQCPHHITT